MAKTIRITTDNRIKILDMTWDIDSQNAAISADYGEIVQTRHLLIFLGDNIVMIVDESGAVKNRPINRVGSWFYNAQVHGCYIHGDILFAKKSGPDILPLDDAEAIKYELMQLFGYLQEE